MDGYRGREDARARTTEKDEVEESEGGVHEMKAKGVGERKRYGEREREMKRHREMWTWKTVLWTLAPIPLCMSPSPSLCPSLSHPVFKLRQYYTEFGCPDAWKKGRRLSRGGRKKHWPHRGLYLGFRRVAVVLGIEST